MNESWRKGGVALLFVFAAIAHTWPLASDLGGHMQSGADPKTMMWTQYDLVRGLAAGSSALFDGTAFHPYSRTIAVVDHQMGNAIVGVPLYLAGVRGVAIFNLLFLATFVLSGFTTYLLARELTGSSLAGIFAGLAFAFGPARIASLPHSHLLATQWMPLALLMLHRYLRRPTTGRAAGFLAATAMVALSSWHIAMIGALGIGIVALAGLLGGRAGVRRWPGVAAAAVVCALMLLPLAGIYGEVAGRWGLRAGNERPIENLTRRSVDLAQGAVALPENSRAPHASLLAGQQLTAFPGFTVLALTSVAIWQTVRRRSRPRAPSALLWALAATSLWFAVAVVGALTAGGESVVVGWARAVSPVLFLALAAGALLLWLVRVWRDEDHDVQTTLAYVSLAAIGFLLALGPRVLVGSADIGSGLWRMDLLPLPLILRAPARFALLVSLGTAVLAAAGMAALLAGRTRRQRLAMAATLLGMLSVEQLFTVGDLAPVPEPTGVDVWLAESELDGAVLEFPIHGNYWAIYASQVFYDRDNVDGRGMTRPRAIHRLRARDDLTPRQLDVVWEDLHPRFVVVRRDLYPEEERVRIDAALEDLRGTLELRAEDGDDVVYELRDRGQGRELRRRWPAHALRAADGLLVFESRLVLDEGRSEGELVVELNGQVLATLSSEELALRPLQRVRFAPDQIQPGINEFVLAGRADGENEGARIRLRSLEVR
jgi:hypothetical protein